MEDDHKGKRKESTQHKVFKVVILLIVGVFCYLIISFVKIEFFRNKTEYNFELNSGKYNYLDLKDKAWTFNYTNNSDNLLDECNMKDFFSEQVSNSKPCIIRKSYSELEAYYQNAINVLADSKLTEVDKLKTKSNTELNLQGAANKIGFMNFAKIFSFSSLWISYGDKNKLISDPVLHNKEYLFLQIDGERKFFLSPITQINKLNPYRNKENEKKSYMIFNPIFSHENLNHLYISKPSQQIIILKTELKKGDMLYIPAYFFVQETNEDENISLKFEFDNNSRILNTMYKVLFDDNFELSNEEQ
jgi:hypothetical protein